MKQGIVFGVIITILSFMIVNYLVGPTYQDGLDIVILHDGEEIYNTPLRYDEGTDVIWYVHSHSNDDEYIFLENEEIIDYYDFDMTVEQLQDNSNIDYERIFEVSGNDVEINMLINSNGSIHVYEANCPDKIDVKIGKISDTSKVITCAPHKLVIKLRSDQAIEGELDA